MPRDDIPAIIPVIAVPKTKTLAIIDLKGLSESLNLLTNSLNFWIYGSIRLKTNSPIALDKFPILLASCLKTPVPLAAASAAPPNCFSSSAKIIACASATWLASVKTFICDFCWIYWIW